MRTVTAFLLTDRSEHESIGVIITKEGQEVLHPERLKEVLVETGSSELMVDRYQCSVNIELTPTITNVDGVMVGGFLLQNGKWSDQVYRMANSLQLQNPGWVVTVVPKSGLALLIKEANAVPTMDTIGDRMECIFHKRIV